MGSLWDLKIWDYLSLAACTCTIKLPYCMILLWHHSFGQVEAERSFNVDENVNASLVVPMGEGLCAVAPNVAVLASSASPVAN